MKHKWILTCSMIVFTFCVLMGCGKSEQAQQTETANDTQTEAQGDTQTAEPQGDTQTAEPQADAQAQDTSGAGDAAQTGAAAQNAQDIISEKKAVKIALADAQVSESDVTGLRVRLETDDGRQEYEVDFYVGNKEYDYDVDAVSGDIISKDMDIDDDFAPNMYGGKNSGGSGGNGTGGSGAAVTEEQAKKTALARVKGAADSDIRIHMDNDDGREVYEGSIVYNEMEYDFEIDAATGKITEWEEESIYDD